MDRLKRHAAAQAIGQMFEQLMQQKQQAEQIMAFKARTKRGFLWGFLLGIPLAVLAYRFTPDWIVTMTTIWLVASGVSAGAGHSFVTNERLTSYHFWLIPQLAASVIMRMTFNAGAWGIIAAGLGVIVMYVIRRVLAMPLFLSRTTFIAYSAWLLFAMALVKTSIKG